MSNDAYLIDISKSVDDMAVTMRDIHDLLLSQVEKDDKEQERRLSSIKTFYRINFQAAAYAIRNIMDNEALTLLQKHTKLRKLADRMEERSKEEHHGATEQVQEVIKEDSEEWKE